MFVYMCVKYQHIDGVNNCLLDNNKLFSNISTLGNGWWVLANT